MDLQAMAGSRPLLPVATRSTVPNSSASSCSLSFFASRNLNFSSTSSFCTGRAELSFTSRCGAGVRAASRRRRVLVRGDGGGVDPKKDATDFRRKSPKETNVVIVGATGYIGKFVVREMVKRGYNVIAVAREMSGVGRKSDREKTRGELPGATVCFSDVTDASALENALKETQPNGGVDVVISCLASRGGGVKDSWLVDYTATRNSLDAGRALGAKHFVLLSAICVQKPLLEFQRAKLRFEEELMAMAGEEEGLTYSVVRPTAFFKSLGGQVKSVQGGGPYVMFGDGALTACKPISEADLARFIADSVSDEEKINKVLPIGGPGKALTPLEQGEILFRIVGKEPKFIKVPIQIMDFFIGQLDFWKRFFPNLEDPAEFGKIGRYYAAESMLVLNPETGKYDADATPSYGSDTLEDFFERVVRDGMVGQELGDQAVF